MMNYIKSECYRIAHTKEIYIFTGVMSGLAALYNLILFLWNQNFNTPDYTTISFSFSFLISGMTFLLEAGAFLATLLFAGERKNGIMKNTIAYGISRERIFFGRSIVCSLAAFFSMTVILVLYIGSGCLLLEGNAEAAVWELLTGIAAVLPCAVAAVILALALLSVFEKEALAIITWLLVMWLIPKVLLVMGIQYETLRQIAGWMPWNFLKNEVSATVSGGFACLWDTSAGMAKCLISGASGIVIFLLAGALLCRKREL